jgi:hypothetical protein
MAETIATLGNLGEFISAMAVVATLVYLSVQVRHSRILIEANHAATEENTRLTRAATMDRYNDVVSRWRGRLIESEAVAALWDKVLRGETVNGADALRLENLWIDWVNTYRSNYSRARATGEEGLMQQAVMTVAAHMHHAPLLVELWDWGRPFNEAASRDFVTSVDRAMQDPQIAALRKRLPLGA